LGALPVSEVPTPHASVAGMPRCPRTRDLRCGGRRLRFQQRPGTPPWFLGFCLAPNHRLYAMVTGNLLEAEDTPEVPGRLPLPPLLKQPAGARQQVVALAPVSLPPAGPPGSHTAHTGGTSRRYPALTSGLLYRIWDSFCTKPWHAPFPIIVDPDRTGSLSWL